MNAAPVSVVVPTIGRIALLRSCLASIAECVPAAAEVLVVDQSGRSEVASLVADLDRPEFVRVECERRGVAHATNVGLATAAYPIVLVTHDDCTVAPNWVGEAWRLCADDPHRIVTGQVLPGSDQTHVPSTISLTEPRDYAYPADFSVLFPNNMVLDRAIVLEFGGFDEAIPFAAEDNDFCYRWLRAGRPMRYEPSLVVVHHDWRSEKELERLYVNYAIGQGVFYAKHLRLGDRRIVPYLLRDLVAGVRGLVARRLRGRSRASDWRQGVLRGLPRGLLRGLFSLQAAPTKGGTGERAN